VVHSGTFEVVGTGAVTVIEKQTFTLKKGDVYNLKSGSA
jgi:hypothetical protein